MTTPGDQGHDLAHALRAARAAVAETAYPLPTPAAVDARGRAEAVLAQLDDYLLPRLDQPGAPLLVVVGGSTGAGKSTLVNSLVRAPVSTAGVLRPTTRAPVLVCHPADAGWFRGSQLLDGLASASAAAITAGGAATGGGAPPARGARRLSDRRTTTPQLVTAPALRPGVAFLDAPDIDSTVAANRSLARRLFAAADLWLFLTTANRYADAVPWQLLREARDRRAVVALVLSRMPVAGADEVVELLTELLREHRLTEVPVFVLPETRVARQGMLPETATAPLRRWFDALAGDTPARASVIQHTLNGAVAALPAALAALATAADEQLAVAEALAEQVGMAYGVARGAVEQGLRAAAPAAGRPAAGDSAGLHDRGDRPGLLVPAGSVPPAGPLVHAGPAAPAGQPGWPARATQLAGNTLPLPRRPPARHAQTSAGAGLIQLVQSAAADAAEQTETAWRRLPAGSALLGPDPVLPSPDLPRQVQRIAREHPQQEWPDRIAELLDSEAATWLARLEGVPLEGGPAARLRRVAADLEQACHAADPASAPAPAPAGPAPVTPEAGR